MGINIVYGENGPPRKRWHKQIKCKACGAGYPNSMSACPLCANKVCHFRMEWEQRISVDRATSMWLESDDWQSMRFAWRNLRQDDLTVRRMKLTCNGREFDPALEWPRPPMITG